MSITSINLQVLKNHKLYFPCVIYFPCVLLYIFIPLPPYANKPFITYYRSFTPIFPAPSFSHI